MNEHYYQLKVKEVIRETADAITIVFEHPEKPLDYKPGQFLTLIMILNGEKIRRSYSLCTCPLVDEDPAVTVKTVEGGAMSGYLVENVKVGQVIEVMEPKGTFTTELRNENKRHIMLFAGGSGITPMMAIIKCILYGEPNSIISLIYANRNERSIIFKDKIMDLQQEFVGRFHVVHVLDNAPLNWQGPSGLLNPGMLKTILAELPRGASDNTQYLMCGPEGMMNNVEATLTGFGIDKRHIYKESFVAGITHKKEVIETAEEVEAGMKAHEVTVIYEGETHKFIVEPDRTILETALDLNIDLPYSCQSGLCTACRGKCLSGKVKLDEEEGLSEQELEEGYVLTCVGHPLTSDVVIEIG